ncbi:hypothetical protein P9D43_25345 [Neobacillus niacini]|uniref:hypothetical protein n=1 Tax=Neobacillus niacini TaxID=86668 RepID=UPI000B08C1C4|nr:hypothetical protein [Neobacillus niacini]MEC1525327.1 hypothetical protein [Neobacillus niacini]
MKEYIFLLEEPLGNKEIKIIASGMTEAFRKAKEFQKNIVRETKSKVNMILKGVRYTD